MLQCIPITAEKNIALGKSAYQSTIYLHYDAGKAVDGKNNNNFAAGSCSHTEREVNPWWAVDLGSVHRVSSVVVTNRAKKDHGE